VTEKPVKLNINQPVEMKIIIKYFLFTTILLSCGNTEKKYTKFLTNGRSNYWNLVYSSGGYNKKDAYLYPTNREYYNMYGTWFSQGYRDGTFVKDGVYDIVTPDTWKLSGDSVIIYDERYRVRIIMLTKDTLKYITEKGDTCIFRNSIGDTRFNYSYYILNDIDSLNVYSLDSIRGNLIYYWIRNDSLGGIFVPITIYKSYDDQIKDNMFHFVFDDDHFHNIIQSTGKFNKVSERFYTSLRFYRTDRKNYKTRLYIDSTISVNVRFKNDSLWINNKLFKNDEKGRIFKKFRGY